MEKIKIGLGICGSYCTFEKMFEAAKELAKEFDVTPIMSRNAAGVDTRFGKAADHIERIEKITGRSTIFEIREAEPLGPKNLIDALVIAPCTGNTMAKMACGITDTSVTMAAKSLLRNGKPIILAMATNDGLSGSACNIGTLLSRKNIYFVPFGQDAPGAKPTSLVADFSQVSETVKLALEGRQIQPLLLGHGG